MSGSSCFSPRRSEKAKEQDIRVGLHRDEVDVLAGAVVEAREVAEKEDVAVDVHSRFVCRGDVSKSLRAQGHHSRYLRQRGKFWRAGATWGSRSARERMATWGRMLRQAPGVLRGK